VSCACVGETEKSTQGWNDTRLPIYTPFAAATIFGMWRWMVETNVKNFKLISRRITEPRGQNGHSALTWLITLTTGLAITCYSTLMMN